MMLARLLLRCALLLALLLLGTVPDGMMRKAGPEGLRLVLCTEDGVREVWLTEDGDTVPVEESERGDHDSARGKPHCVQVALASQDVPPPLAAGRVGTLRPVERAQPPHQVRHRQIADHARRTRAPPVSLV